MEKQRYAFIDILRIIACFLVIVNHTNSSIFLSCGPSTTWFLSVLYFFVCKVAVPVFIMISGYTMLHRIDDYKKIVQKIIRIALILLVFSLFYYVDDYLTGVRTFFGVKDFIITILNNPITNAFWYLYLYIGLLIMLPFLQKMVSALDKKDFHIFFIISIVVFGMWPIVEHVLPSLQYSRDFMIPLFDSYICMLLAGYYMRKYVTPTKTKLILSVVLFCAACAANVIMTYVEYVKNGGTNYLFYDNRVYLPILVESVSLFYMISHIKINEKCSQILKVIGGCTFGIYLISDFFIEKTAFIYNQLCASGMYIMIAVVIYEVAVFILGFIVTYLLKLIPGVKKLL